MKSSGYTTQHRNIRQQRGAASKQICIDCGSVAADWSLRHGTPNLLSGSADGVTLLYSLDIMAYEPRCKKCHAVYDMQVYCRSGRHLYSDTAAPDGVKGRACRECKRESTQARRIKTGYTRSFVVAGKCRKGLHDVTDPRAVYTDPKGNKRCRECQRITQAANHVKRKMRLRLENSE
jgi:hypothetical protein